MTMPAHAPYDDVEEGEPVEVRVFVDPEDAGSLIAECEFRGDTFGGKAPLDGADLSQKIAVDELVLGIAMLVWNELLGTPVFREEDHEWVERIEARAPWEGMERRPTNGWVTLGRTFEPEPEHVPRVDLDEEPEIEHLHRTMGDAHVEDLRLTQEEMAALARGEIPDDLVARMMRARSVENLLESVERVLYEIEPENGSVARAKQELAEVMRRFRDE